MVKPSIEDRQAITELLSEYGLYIDLQRFDEWDDLFTDDAIVEAPGLDPMRTRAERRALAEGAPTGLHMAAPPVLHPGASADTVHGEQSFMWRNALNTKFLPGWYEDEYVRREGRWYIARRVIRYVRPPRPPEGS